MLAAPYMDKEYGEGSSSDSSSESRVPSTAGNPGSTFGVPNVSNPQGDTSPFNTPLSDADITGDTARELETAVRAQFSPDFSTKLFAALTGEGLRDFMAKYDAYQREVGMNTDPEVALQEYLQATGKGTASSTGGGSDLNSEIDNFQF